MRELKEQCIKIEERVRLSPEILSKQLGQAQKIIRLFAICLIAALVVIFLGGMYSLHMRNKMKEMEQEYTEAVEETKKHLEEHFKQMNKEEMEEIKKFMEENFKKMPKFIPYKKNGVIRYRIDTKGLSSVESSVVKGIAVLRFIKEHYGALITKWSKHRGIEEALIYAFISIESQGNKQALSLKTAIGLMQIRPKTAIGMGYNPDELVDPNNNIGCGTKYIAYLGEMSHIKNDSLGFGFEWTRITAYNTGPHPRALKNAWKNKGNPNSEGGSFYLKIKGVWGYILTEQALIEKVLSEKQNDSSDVIATRNLLTF